MNRPRFSNTAMMAMIGIGALEAAWLSADPAYWAKNMAWTELLIVSAAPMAGILGLGLLFLLFAGPGRCDRSFLSGFEFYGMAALFLHVACTRLFTHAMNSGAVDFVERFVSPGTPYFVGSLAALYLLPQVLVAALGGVLTCRYTIRIIIDVQRRRHGENEHMLASQGV